MIIAAFGEGWCFLIDGVSYFAVIASLLLMRIAPRRPRAATAEHAGADPRGLGLRASASGRSAHLLLLFALVCLMGWPYTCCCRCSPATCCTGARTRSAGSSAAAGVGALVSGLSLALRHSVPGLTRSIQIAAPRSSAAGLILFGLSHALWLSLLLMMLVGFGMMQCASRQQHGHPGTGARGQARAAS